MYKQIADEVISIYFLVVNIRSRLIINSSLIFYELKGSYKTHMDYIRLHCNVQQSFRSVSYDIN
jgi:hypothetical protein